MMRNLYLCSILGSAFLMCSCSHSDSTKLWQIGKVSGNAEMLHLSVKRHTNEKLILTWRFSNTRSSAVWVPKAWGHYAPSFADDLPFAFFVPPEDILLLSGDCIYSEIQAEGMTGSGMRDIGCQRLEPGQYMERQITFLLPYSDVGHGYGEEITHSYLDRDDGGPNQASSYMKSVYRYPGKYKEEGFMADTLKEKFGRRVKIDHASRIYAVVQYFPFDPHTDSRTDGLDPDSSPESRELYEKMNRSRRALEILKGRKRLPGRWRSFVWELAVSEPIDVCVPLKRPVELFSIDRVMIE